MTRDTNLVTELYLSHSYLKEIVNFKREKKEKNWGVSTTAKTQTYSNGKISSPNKQKNFDLQKYPSTKTDILSS